MAKNTISKQQQEKIMGLFFDELSFCSFEDLTEEKIADSMIKSIKSVLLGNNVDYSPAEISSSSKSENSNLDKIFSSETSKSNDQSSQTSDDVSEESDHSSSSESNEVYEETIEQTEEEVAEQKEANSNFMEDSGLNNKPLSKSDTVEISDILNEKIDEPTPLEKETMISDQDNDSVSEENQTETTNQHTKIILNTQKQDFFVFDHRLEKEVDKKLQQNKIYDEEFNKFMFDEKEIFPMMNGKISLFGLYLIKYFLNLINEKNLLDPKYTVNMQIDDDRAPAHLTQLWDKGAKDLNYKQDSDSKIIFFSDKESADKMAKTIISSASNGVFECLKTKSSDFDFKLDSLLPVNSKNIVSFPLFSLTQTDKIIDSFLDIEELLNLKIKKGILRGKTYIKVMYHDEWKKGKWLSYFSDLINMFNKTLSKEELSLFSFDTPENIYEKLINNPEIADSKLFIIRDLTITPFDFKKMHVDSHYADIYKLIYYSWIRFLILPQQETQTIEQFEYNMYSFVCDTKIYSKKGPMLFRPKLFVEFDPYIRTLPEIAQDQEVIVDKKQIFVKKERIGCFNINQLNLLFPKHQINWLNFYFILETLVSLIENGLIDVYKNNIIINEKFKFYYDQLKKENFNSFFDNVTAAFDSYFAKDIKSFIEKITEINKNPF